MADVRFDHVYKRYGEATSNVISDLNLHVRDHEFLVLVGPSGCGKSTALRMIAGLEEITDGDLFIGDRRVNDLDPKDRDIAMVFQNYALYPHMNVFDNMAFSLKLHHLEKPEIDRRVRTAADMLGISDYLARKPRELSGGQRQRVALGRAIVREPSVFLMDEPLSNLDAKLRVQTRAEIARLHQRLGTTTVYVTHDQVEAMTMGTRIAVMSRGLLQQVGPPQELYDNPKNLFVAGFIGSPAMNFAKVTADGGNVAGEGFSFPVPSRYTAGLNGGKALVAGFRPEHLELGDLSQAAGIRAKADVVEYLGNEELLHVTVEGHEGDVVAVVGSDHHVRPGDIIELKLPLDRLHLFDAESGDAVPHSVAAAAA
jgi:multiple sugar transport system ATP-binding protein